MADQELFSRSVQELECDWLRSCATCAIRAWGLLFDQREKCREGGQEFRQFRRAGWREVSLAGRGAFEAVVKILLETRSLDIEGEDLPGVGMLSGQPI